VRPQFFASIAAASTLLAVLLPMPRTLEAQAGQGAPPPARGGTPPAGRGAPPPPVTTPYVRPVSKYVPPRTPDGQPDISGLYVAISLPRNIETPLVPPPARGGGGGRGVGEYSFNVPNERARLPPGAEDRPAVVDPADGKIPLQPWALEKRRHTMANQDKIEYLDGRVLCLPPGMIRTTIPAPVVGYHIMQKPGYVVIFYEQSHLYRAIPIDGRPPLHPNIRKAMGVSRGRWEGNTLVVEVTNSTTTLDNDWVVGSASANPALHSDSLASGHGISHSDVYKVTERYTPIDADTIHYEATIEDPKVFTRPWKVAYYAFARAPKDYVPIEYACFEGNEKNLQLMTGTDISGIRVNVP
jgi:hypothetical protein